MHTALAVIIMVLLLLLLLAWLSRCEHREWRTIYRACWLDVGDRLEQMTRVAQSAIAERDEWIDTAQANLLARGHHRATIAALKKEVTDQASHVDSLMNGDRRCVGGHRYYTGQGITCPHCAAEEASSIPELSLRRERKITELIS